MPSPVSLRQIGDVVSPPPPFTLFGSGFPDALSAIIVEPAAAPIVVDNRICRSNRGAACAVEPGDDRYLSARPAPPSRGCDLAIDFTGAARIPVTWVSGAPERIGYEVAAEAGVHARMRGRERCVLDIRSEQWTCSPLGIAPPDRALAMWKCRSDAAAARRSAIDSRGAGSPQAMDSS